MAEKIGKGRRSVVAASPAGSEEFAQSLKRRRDAAHGLEQDLLTKVPLLYGSPGGLEPHGDPGVILAQTHQDELVRRNHGGVLNKSRRRSDVVLPFERTTTAIAILLVLLFLFVK